MPHRTISEAAVVPLLIQPSINVASSASAFEQLTRFDTGQLAGRPHIFVISAEGARPLIAEVALYYARTLIASALSHARNADGECTASI